MHIKRYRFVGLWGLIVLFLLPSCKVADLRTAMIKEATDIELEELQTKGKTILSTAYEQQGLAKFEARTNYTFQAHEKWYGMMGKIANSWGVNDVDMQFSYRINSFDGRVEVLSGEERGIYFGLQSWQYYEGNTEVLPDFGVKRNEKIVFSISAYQYFMELLVRLQNVPVIEYAGSREIDGVLYDMVLTTWGKNSTPSTAYDQYLVFINKKTGLLDYCTYTAHDSELPGNKSMVATIRFANYQNIEGVLIPMVQEVMVSSPKKDARLIHRMEIASFDFDVVADKVLRPDSSLPLVGDEKMTHK